MRSFLFLILGLVLGSAALFLGARQLSVPPEGLFVAAGETKGFAVVDVTIAESGLCDSLSVFADFGEAFGQISGSRYAFNSVRTKARFAVDPTGSHSDKVMAAEIREKNGWVEAVHHGNRFGTYRFIFRHGSEVIAQLVVAVQSGTKTELTLRGKPGAVRLEAVVTSVGDRGF